MSDVVVRAKTALEDVTEGGWLHLEDICGCYSVDAKPDLVCLPIAESIPNEADAAFIAAARTLVPELVAEIERMQAEHDPGKCYSSDVMERARYARSHGNFDALHAELIAEIERLHHLIQRGLAIGDQFRTPYAAGARAELRRSAGLQVGDS